MTRHSTAPHLRTPVPKMRTLDQKGKVLEALYEHPEREFSIRQLSKEAKLSKSSVERVLVALKKERMLDKSNRILQSPLFRIRKINHFTEKIAASGLIGHLEERANPSCIILFGSFSKGESNKESDIDLFVEAPEKGIPDVSPYEKALGHKIEIFAKERASNLPPHLFNNVVNGIKLAGYLKLK
jgi:predicted nucleotidyltransferase